MNKSKRKIFLLLFCVMAIVSAVSVIPSKANAGVVTGYQKVTWGISSGQFYVNGIHAFCAHYSKTTPPTGTVIASIVPCTNEVLQKALYYGYNGPGNMLGTDERALVLTSIAVSDANIGEAATGVSAKYDEFYWDIVNNPSNYPSPPGNFKTYLAHPASDKLQPLAFYELLEKPKAEVTKCQKDTDIPIPGTVFEHTKPDGSIEQFTTDESGKFRMEELDYGTHKIREISAAEGYIQNEEVYPFTVDEGTTEIVRITVYNDPAPYDAVIHKTDLSENRLEGAEFTLYTERDCLNEVEKGMTDEEGLLRFHALKVGKKYYLKETKAPAGYQIMTEDGEQHIYEIYALSTPANDDFLFYIDGKEYHSGDTGEFTLSGTKADREIHMTITNEVEFILPDTGSYAMLAMPAVGLALCSLSMYFTKKEREKEKTT